LALSPGEESVQHSASSIQTSQSDAAGLPPLDEQPKPRSLLRVVTAAYIPFSYISDARQRIEIYRKLAQATEKTAVENLKKELRDRFGPVPAELELLLLLAETKILAADRGITVLEVKEDRLMLTRNNDYVMVGSKFPRLTKPDAAGRLKEIKKLLLAL